MQAVVLAGGKGTRLGNLAGGRPKPLVDVGGRPFILYLFDSLRRHGITDVVLLVGPFARVYEDMLGDGSAWGLNLTFIAEEPPAGTAGALSYAASLLAPEFLMLNGDSFFDFNLLDLYLRPGRGDPLAILALREIADAGRYGTVTLDDGVVTQFGEKSQAGAGIINGGVYWMRRAILKEIGALPASLEQDVLPRLVQRGAVQGKIYNGHFVDIGIPEDLTRASRVLPEWIRRPAVFFDRDGVLNRDTGYVHRPENFVWLDGAKEAIKRINDMGWFVIVITNQAGIARGFYEPDDVERLHRWMNEQLAPDGAHIDAFYYCPHHPEEGREPYRQACDCRKPAPGLLLQAMREWPVRADLSVMIGDKDSDMAAARQAGVRGVLYQQQNLDELVAQVIGKAA